MLSYCVTENECPLIVQEATATKLNVLSYSNLFTFVAQHRLERSITIPHVPAVPAVSRCLQREKKCICKVKSVWGTSNTFKLICWRYTCVLLLLINCSSSSVNASCTTFLWDVIYCFAGIIISNSWCFAGTDLFQFIASNYYLSLKSELI